MGLFRKRRNRRLHEREDRGDTTGVKVKKMTRGVVLLVTLLALFGGLPLVAWVGYQQVLSSGYFAPDQISVQGNHRVSQEEIIDAAGLLEEGVDLLSLDVIEAEHAIEKLAWVEDASIQTELPGSVVIQVKERDYLGMVSDEQLYLVDQDAKVIKPWEGEDLDGPIVSGVSLLEESPLTRERVRTAFEIARLYQGMGLNRWGGLSEVHYEPVLGYALFAGDTEVRLGNDRFDERLKRLWQVFVLLEERETRAEYVLLDMDQSLDRVAVKPWPRVAPKPVETEEAEVALN